MRTLKPRLSEWLGALCLCAAVLLGTLCLARQVTGSALYMESQILSSIFSEPAVDVRSILYEKPRRDALFKFLGAAATAYVNFEMLPVYEANTFAAVIQALPAGVRIDAFAYSGRNLTISGRAGDSASCRAFLQGLDLSGHFRSVSGSFSTAANGEIYFKIEAAARV